LPLRSRPIADLQGLEHIVGDVPIPDLAPTVIQTGGVESKPAFHSQQGIGLAEMPAFADDKRSSCYPRRGT